LWVGLAGRPYARPGGAEHPEPVSNPNQSLWELCGQSRSISETLGAWSSTWGFQSPGRNSLLLVFYFLGFAACFAATDALLFCFVAAAFACFCAACFCVDFGDLSPICLNYPLGLADASLESTNFWDCPFDTWASALSQQRITNWQNRTISSKSGRETLQRKPRSKKRSSASSGPPIHLRLRWRRSKSL